MSGMSSFVVDPLYDKFFKSAKFFYWYMPLNPYRLFLGPLTSLEFIYGRFCYYLVLLTQLFLMLLYIMFLINAVAFGKDLLIVAATFVWLALNILTIYYMYFSWNSGQEMVDLLHALHDLFPKPEDTQERANADRWAREWTAKMTVHTSVFNVAITGMVSMPIILSFVGYLETGSWVNHLPLSLWIPFDALKMPVYPFVYVLEIWFILVHTYIGVAPLCIMGGATLLICLQFKSVAEKFRNLQFGRHQDDLLKINDAIMSHNRVLEVSSRIRTVFSVPVMMIFVLSSTVICIFMFLAVNEEDAILQIQNTINVICFLIFYGFINYLGNLLMKCVSRWSICLIFRMKISIHFRVCV